MTICIYWHTRYSKGKYVVDSFKVILNLSFFNSETMEKLKQNDITSSMLVLVCVCRDEGMVAGCNP